MLEKNKNLTSNIVAGSNVYLVKEERPFWDAEFVAQLKDYAKLSEVKKRYKVESKVKPLSDVQMSASRRETRCTYAKNDPCWGVVRMRNGRVKVISKCINGNCPKIFECNPAYTIEEENYWKNVGKESASYGNPKDPKQQPKYYLVDLVAEEERKQYYTVPLEKAYPIIGKKTKYSSDVITDPKTGRKKVIVGYKWIITDNASYESEELKPIYRYVDNITEQKKRTTVLKKAKRISKKTDIDISEKPLAYREYENLVQNSIVGSIHFSEMDRNNIGKTSRLILLENPAELALVSKALLDLKIDHGMNLGHEIMLTTFDDFCKYNTFDSIIVSSTIIKKGCKQNNVASWKLLSNKSSLTELRMTERDYRIWRMDSSKERWSCGNLYGVTHICVLPEDFKNTIFPKDGTYPIRIQYEDDVYTVSIGNGKRVGNLSIEFMELIDSMIKAEAVSGMAEEIEGITIRINDGKMEVLGIGRMRFNSY